MYQQRVKHVAYLAKAVIKLDEVEQNYQALVLPSGAEVIQVNLEVTQANTGGGTLDIGLNEVNDFFSANIDLSKLENSNSGKVTQLKEISFVTLNASAKLTDGEVVLRVQYFLPSEIMTEF